VAPRRPVAPGPDGPPHARVRVEEGVAEEIGGAVASATCTATRRLFELLYTKLWKEKLGKADALWQAKMALRTEGHPPRDWAGWVLSGDPD
jgi:hypothetical protein